MKKLRFFFYALYVLYLGATLYMVLDIEDMMGRFGMVTFFTFLRKWFVYGIGFFLIILVVENINSWWLRRQLQYKENENIDLKIRIKDLRRQVQQENENTDLSRNPGQSKS